MSCVAESNILVTGGAGFIGSNFLRLLLSDNDDSPNLIVLDALKYSGNINTINDLIKTEKITFIEGNILNCELVTYILKHFNINYIVNFAAESHVDRSIVSPLEFIKTNTLGCIYLLESAFHYWQSLPAKQKNSFRFLQISTDEVYGQLRDDGVFQEESHLNPSSPYSASKASADLLGFSFYKTFGFPIIVTRCSNNYGPYQHPEKLIPVIILNALSEKTIPIYGNGKNVRDWIHVDDHCRGIKLCLELGTPGEIYCIGGDNQIPNIELANIICSLLDSHPKTTLKTTYNKFITFVEDRKGHDYRYAIDFTKIANQLGYQPKVDFAKGISQTVDWYINNIDWCNSFTKNQ